MCVYIHCYLARFHRAFVGIWLVPGGCRIYRATQSCRKTSFGDKNIPTCRLGTWNEVSHTEGENHFRVFCYLVWPCIWYLVWLCVWLLCLNLVTSFLWLYLIYDGSYNIFVKDLHRDNAENVWPVDDMYTLKFIPASGNCICHKTEKPIWSNNVKSSLPRWLCFEQRQTFGYCLNHFWYRTSAFQQYHQRLKQLNSKASQLFQKNIFQILSGFWLQRDIMGDCLCECHLMQTLAPNSTQTFTISPFLF